MHWLKDMAKQCYFHGQWQVKSFANLEIKLLTTDLLMRVSKLKTPLHCISNSKCSSKRFLDGAQSFFF